MKSLNDSLREEFSEILNDSDMKQIVVSKKLEGDIINRAFEKLLENKYATEELAVDKGRAEFETYIINTLKSKTF